MDAVPPAAPERERAGAWPGVCEQFSQQILLLAEQLRPAMDRLEEQEEDPDRLQLLYQMDHAVTRMRRTASELRVLAGAGGEELGGHTTSLVDVIRMAESAIERYTQVGIGTVVQLAVVAYAAEDVGVMIAALLDNATRYSPSTVTVSAHLLDSGGVMMRIEDEGIGIETERLRAINATLAGPVPPLALDTGRHTGFPVVHRLARKYGIGVQLACRPSADSAGTGSGTIAMVVIPAALLCEVPGEVRETSERPDGPLTHGTDQNLAHLTLARRADAPDRPAGGEPTRPSSAAGELPRRESVSLRGTEDEHSLPRRESTPRDRDRPAQAAQAAQAFAADVQAFSEGGRAAAAPDSDGGTGTVPTRAGPADPSDESGEAREGRTV